MFGVLLEAMKIGKPLYIHGSLASITLLNARLKCEVWRNMLLIGFSIISIHYDNRIPSCDINKVKNENAISAFSSGMNEKFITLRHSQKNLVASSHHITHIIKIHGLDVDTDNTMVFNCCIKG